MIFYYLLAGHLVGDFTLQNNTIASKKMKSTAWVFIHSVIVTISMLVFSLPLGYKVLFSILISGIVHFLIDCIKAKISSKTPVKTFAYFLIDQLCHILFIYFVSALLEGYPNFIIHRNIVFFCISFFFVLSFSSVCIQFLLKIICNLGCESFYINNEKSIGNINRIIVFITMFISSYYSIKYMIIIPLSLICWAVYYRERLKNWMPTKYFVIKIFLEIIFSISGFYIFEFLKD